MAVLPTRTERDSNLGRTSTTTEVHTGGTRNINSGAQTTTQTQATPAQTTTRTSTTPETAVVSRTPVHVGVKFQFTLKFRDLT
jgi:hypothetical protein